MARLPLLIFLIHGLHAQVCLTLSTARAAPGETVSLDLELKSNDQTPASLQWTLQFPSSGILSLKVEGSQAMADAGKSVICAENPAGYICMAVGNNANPILDGVIARVTAVLAPDFTTSVLSLLDPFAASPDGYFVPISASGGTVTSALVSPDRRLRPPLTRISGRCPTP